MTESVEIPPPPGHVRLRPGDAPFWRSVMLARESGYWLDAELILAGHLARCMADVERVAADLDAEGDVIANPGASLAMNPRRRLLDLLSARAAALTRVLGLHGRARGHVEDVRRRRRAEADARQAMQQIAAEGGLIPS